MTGNQKEAAWTEEAGLAPAAPADLGDLDTPSLVDHIITRYHRVHTQELPELVTLATRVEEVHKGHPAVPAGLGALLQQMLGELAMHMQKEELMLFPRMKRGMGEGLGMPVMVMMTEHDDHAEHLRTLSDLTGGFQLPADACGSWRSLYAGVEKFADDLATHIRIENEILFPRFMES